VLDLDPLRDFLEHLQLLRQVVGLRVGVGLHLFEQHTGKRIDPLDDALVRGDAVALAHCCGPPVEITTPSIARCLIKNSARSMAACIATATMSFSSSCRSTSALE
jgi:hypothetical protein